MSTTTKYARGRRVNHDSRSRMYPAYAPATKPRSMFWPSQAPTLDQGRIGACTGNAAVDWLNTDYAVKLRAARAGKATVPFLTETDALRLYSEATRLDGLRGTYPPDDTGSDGNSVAKACRNEGLITGWRHSFGGVAQLVQVLQVTPVIAGTLWTDSMEDVGATGRIRPSGTTDEGHEYLIAGVDVPGQRVWIRNSWSDGWGVPAPTHTATGRGYAWITFADCDRLLAEQGDVTVLVIA